MKYVKGFLVILFFSVVFLNGKCKKQLDLANCSTGSCVTITGTLRDAINKQPLKDIKIGLASVNRSTLFYSGPNGTVSSNQQGVYTAYYPTTALDLKDHVINLEAYLPEEYITDNYLNTQTGTNTFAERLYDIDSSRINTAVTKNYEFYPAATVAVRLIRASPNTINQVVIRYGASFYANMRLPSSPLPSDTTIQMRTGGDGYTGINWAVKNNSTSVISNYKDSLIIPRSQVKTYTITY